MDTITPNNNSNQPEDNSGDNAISGQPVGGSVVLPSSAVPPGDGEPLEGVPESAAASTPLSGKGPKAPRPARALIFAFAAFTIGGLALVGFLFAASKNPKTPTSTTGNNADNYSNTSLSLSDLPASALAIDADKQLAINGQLKVNGAFVLTPSDQPTAPVAGQIYFDSKSNQVYYYNGASFQNLLNRQDVVSTIGGSLGAGLAVVNSKLTNTGQLANTGVLSLQGQNGNVTLTAGGGITISGTTITNSGVTGLGGNTGNVTVGTGLSAAGGTLKNSGVITLVSGTPGSLTVSNDGSGNYTVSQAGSGSVILGPSSIQVDASNNPGINFTKTGSGNLLQLAIGNTPTNEFVVDQTGAITTGTIDFGQVTGKPTFVTSLAGTANQISVSSGGVGAVTLSLPQDIALSSSPTFANLTLTNPLTIGNGGTGATSAANARLNLGAAKSGANSDITSLSGLTTPLSIGQGGTGLTVTPSNGQLIIGNGTGYQAANITNSDGKVQIINGPGSIEINVPAAGQCTLCADRSLDNLAGVAINSNLLPQSAAGIDLGSSSLPLQDLYFAGSSAMPGSNNFKITGTATAARTITFPDATGTICLSSNNCGFQASGSYVNLQASTPGVAQTGNINITGTLIAGNLSGVLNGVTLSSAGTSQFTVSGGSPSSHTLTITGDSSINQNLLTTSGPTFSSLTLTNALTIANGGTGLQATPSNGQLVIGNGTGYTLSTLTAGAGISIANAAGSITISAPTAGSCASCANQALSNLSGVAINTSLLSGTSGVNLGSTASAFHDLYLYGGGTLGSNSFRVTGTATGNRTVTLDNKDGTVALVQTAGSSTTQTGDINVSGALIAAGSIQGTLLKTADISGATSNLAIRSGNSSGSTSGNITIDVGTAGATAGTITIGDTNATGLTLGSSALAVSAPGGLNTSGGNINTGSGTITSGDINGQTISATANFTGDVTVAGTLNVNTITPSGSMTIGSTGQDILLQGANTSITDTASGNTATLTFVAPTANVTYRLQTAAAGTYDICTSAGNCSATGNTVTETSSTTNRIPYFDSSTDITSSSLEQTNSTTVTLLGSTTQFIVQGGTSGGTGNASLTLGTSSSTTGSITFNNEGDTGAVTLASGTVAAGNSYTLKLPTTLDTSGQCLNVGAGGQIGYFACISGGGGGGGAGVTGSGTTGQLVRWTNGGTSVVGDSVIQDNGSRVGVNIAPDATAILKVGSSGVFKVTNTGDTTIGALTVNTNASISGGLNNNSGGLTNTGSIAGATTITASGLIQTNVGSQALSLTGAPTNVATQSLAQFGGAISGGNNSANGGTYLGLNAPASGAGSAADFLDFQANSVKKLVVDKNGNFTTAGTYNGLTLASQAVGFTIAGGTTSKTLTLSGDSTINQDLSTTSNTVAFGKINSLTTKLETSQGGTGANLSGSLAGAVAIYDATNNKFAAARLRSSDSSLTITSTDGDVNLQVASCSTCANTSLSNLTGTTSVNSSLLAQSGVDLGSATAAWRNIYLYGTGTFGSNSFKLTGAPSANQVITIPDATGTICLDTNNCNYQAAGSYVHLSPGAQDSGFINISGNAAAGTFDNLTLTQNADGFAIAGGSTNSRTLTVTTSNVTLNQNLRTTDNVTFNNVTANGTLSVTSTSTLTGNVIVSNLAPPTSTALTIGATGSGQTTSLQGTTVSFTNGSRSYSFNSTASGSQTICDTSGNCASAGGGVTTTGGTTNYLSKFTASQTIANSVIYDDGTNVEIGGASPTALLTLLGAQPATVAGAGTNATKVLGVTGGTGGNTSGTGTTAGNGADISLTAGTGGTGTGTNNNGGNGGNITFQAGSGGAATGSGVAGSAGYIALQASGGSVGIGTTNPLSKLDVQGGSINTSANIMTGGTNRLSNTGALSNITGYTQTSGTLSVTSANNSSNIVAVTDSSLNTDGANLASLGFTNANTANSNVTVTGISVQPAGSINSNGNKNTDIGLNLASASVTTGNLFYGINIGTGYDDILRYNNTQLISGSGFVQNAAIDSSLTYTNLAKVGSLSVAGNLTFTQGSNRTISIAQASSGTGNNLTIAAGQGASGANAGGNLILQAGAQGTSGGTGSVIVKANGTDSTTAFQVQQAGSTAVLTADTTNSQVKVQGINSVAAVGSELLTGNCSGTNWSGTGSGPYTHTAGAGTATLTCTITGGVVSGATYQIVFDVSSTQGNAETVTPAIGGVNGIKTIGSPTGFTAAITTTSTANPTLTTNSPLAPGLTISNISFKQVTIANNVLAVNNSNATTGLEVRSGGSGLGNSFIGLSAGQADTTGNFNSAVGSGALQSNLTGGSNSVFGYQAAGSGTTAGSNAIFGYQAFQLANSSNNVAVGYQALQNDIKGGSNVAVGYQALQSNGYGSGNIAVGYQALLTNNGGGSNTAIGYQAIKNASNASNSVALGYQALFNGSNLTSNTAIGVQSLLANTNGTYDTGVGYLSLGSINGSFVGNNTGLGAYAGYQDPAGFATTAGGTNMTVLGYYAQAQLNNSLILGGQGANAVNVSIGTTSPTNTLSVSPDQYDTGSASTTASTTVVGSGTTWTAAMVGSEFIFANGNKYTITAFTDATHLTLSSSSTNGSQAYRIHRPAFQVTSTGLVGIGTAAPTYNLQVVTQSNTTTAFAVQNAAGNNLINVDTTNGNVTIDNSGIAGTIQVGNTTGAVSQTINIGNNATASSTSNVNIGSGVAGTTTIKGDSSSSIIIGSTNTTTVGFLSPTANVVYNFDTATAGTYKVCTTANTGSGGVCAPSAGSTNYIQNGTSTQTANYAIQSAASGSVAAVIKGAASQSVDILDVATSSTNIFTIGSAGAITASAGANFQFTGTTAFQIQNNAGAFTLMAADTTNKLLKVGNGSNTISSSTTGGLFVTDIIEGLNGVKLNGGTIVSTTGQLRYSGAARNAKTINLIPEYVGAVLNGSGIGTMTSDFCSGTGKRSVNTGVCTVSTDEHNYYNWTTSQGSAQTYTIWVRSQIPSDFDKFSTSGGTDADTSNHSIKMYGWGTDSNHTVQLSVYNASGTLCGTGGRTVSSTNGTWAQTDYATGSDNENSCSIAGGDIVTFKIVMSSNSTDSTKFARAGEITYSYNSKF